MRFTEAGPSIPNELLDSRDAGDVVFLCGAGISIPAGLPDFFWLTVDVADRLGVAPDSQVGRMLEVERSNRASGSANSSESISFDRVFTLLTRLFGSSQVEAEVVNALSSGRRHNLKHHRALLDLARGPDGRQRLITTNFDRLFQKAQPRLHSYRPPHFPDLSRRDGFDGVVHLHGILPAAPPRHAVGSLGLILSSGDFGRAYLADGWATRFICDLLDRHIVVLLGYSADDPPVRYLLEGLSLSGRIGERRLFAFAAGDPKVIDSNWRERGVVGIAYDPAGHHRHLWETIHGWAERARDLTTWRSRIVSLARTLPDQLKPFERGQVAALCASSEGAIAFTSAKPPPPAEWLCVFDSYCRYSKPGRSVTYGETPTSEVDPLQSYGLDDDPPRGGERDQTPPGTNLLSALRSDDPVAPESGIIDWRRSAAPLNPRLFQMAGWIEAVMSSPTAPWWAAGRGPLHEDLYRRLSWRLDRDATFDPVVRQAWRLILEAQDSLPDHLREGWHGISAQIQQEGWTARTVRLFADATRPRISAARPWLFAPIPPQAGSAPLTLSQIARFEVVYPELTEDLASIPEGYVAAVLQGIRRNLEHGFALEQETSQYSPKLPTLYPEQMPGQHHYSDVEKYYTTFAKLFRRLASFDPAGARREFLLWNNQIRFFAPLQIWALAEANISSAGEAGRTLRQLGRDTFWNSEYSRELLWTIRARWTALSERDRKGLEAKIVQGRLKYSFETNDEYTQRRASQSAARLAWMQGIGLKLSTATRARLRKLKRVDPQWSDSWAKTADASHESRVGYVKQEVDPAPITNLAVSKVIARCEELAAQREFGSFTEHDPFRGLVEAKPKRAMAVLAYEARRHNYPRKYWSRLLSYWPKSAAPSLLVDLASRLAKLPSDALISIRYEVSSWFGNHYSKLDRVARKTAHHGFDQILSALASGDAQVLTSAIGKTSVGGVEIPSNRMGVNYAINAPTGHLAQGLIDALFDRKPKRGRPIAKDLRIRLDRLLSLPGEAGWHALTIVSQQLHGLFVVDPKWTKNSLLPRFNPEHASAEAAWSGFLAANLLARPVRFRSLKNYFLGAIAATPRWTAEDLAHLGQHLLLAIEPSSRRVPLLSFQEGRTALRASSPALRQQVLWFLRNRAAAKGAWDRLVVPFFQRVWPREREFQNANTTRALLQFLTDLDERFSDGVSLVADFLVPAPDTDLFVYQFGSDREHGHADLTAQYPLDTLFLLNRIVNETTERAPYGLAEVVSRLATAAPEVRHDDRWQRLHRLTLA